MSERPYLSIRNLGTREAPRPLIKVSRGGRARRYFAASKEGAAACGRWLGAEGCDEFVCSSTIDFPTEEGAPDLDFRELIAEAAGDLGDIE